MRKSCRWLGYAALMCFATLNLPDSCSTSLEAGFKLPWRKDRSSSDRKDAKSTAEESSDLLAKARAYERAGDFPNATRAYRQYLDGGGAPQAMKQTDETADAVTNSDNKPSSTESRDKSEGNGRNAGSRAKADTRLTSKSKEKTAKKAKDPDFERNLGLSTPGTIEDPWANQPDADSEESASAPQDEVKQTASTEADVASTPKHQPAGGVTKESFDNLLDLDSGKLNWGDEPKLPEGDAPAGAGTTAEVASAESPQSDAALTDAPWAKPKAQAEAHTPQTSADTSLPLIDFGAKETSEPSQTPVVADAQPADQPDWAITPVESPSTPSEAVADDNASPKNEPDEFAPPIIEEEENLAPPKKPQAQSPVAWAADEGESTKVASTEPAKQSMAAKCQKCEPLVYAQVVKLDSSDPEARKEGLDLLADMGRKAHPAAPAVRATLKDADPFVQAHAAWACWRIENDASVSVETLQTLLKNSDANVVELACYILGDIGAPADSTVEALSLLRDHAEGTTKVQAAEALVRISGVDDKSLKILTTAVKSKDGQVRWSAAVALGRCRSPQSTDAAVTALTGALKDVDPEVRSAAALSLGGLGKDAEKATPELQRIASSDTAQVREAALAALACLKL